MCKHGPSRGEAPRPPCEPMDFSARGWPSPLPPMADEQASQLPPSGMGTRNADAEALHCAARSKARAGRTKCASVLEHVFFSLHGPCAQVHRLRTRAGALEGLCRQLQAQLKGRAGGGVGGGSEQQGGGEQAQQGGGEQVHQVLHPPPE